MNVVDELEARLRAAIDAGDSGEIDRLAVLMDEAEAVERAARKSPTLAGSALWYAEQGIRVFPLRPGSKIPMPGSNGCKDATTDLSAVRSWWERHPDANIGLATGHRFTVIDVDGPQGQRSRVARWDDVFGPIDAESVGKVLTPRLGGMHIYVPTRGETNKAGIAASIDVRGAGGYVVAPPSVTDQGVYEWLGSPRLHLLPPEQGVLGGVA